MGKTDLYCLNICPLIAIFIRRRKIKMECVCVVVGGWCKYGTPQLSWKNPIVTCLSSFIRRKSKHIFLHGSFYFSQIFPELKIWSWKIFCRWGVFWWGMSSSFFPYYYYYFSFRTKKWTSRSGGIRWINKVDCVGCGLCAGGGGLVGWVYAMCLLVLYCADCWAV